MANWHDEKHAAGSFVGRPPWGYEIRQAGDVKTLASTAEGRLWVPQIFHWIAEGRTLAEVSRMLAQAGVESGAAGGGWYTKTLHWMIHNTTYSGMRERKGYPPLQVPALVPRALQARAMAALASNAHPRASGPAQPRVLLAKLKCGHPDCPGHGLWPMYRVKGTRYRCFGIPPQRQGCGAPTISIADLDELVIARIPHLASLDLDQRRAFLANRDIKAWRVGETIHLTIDGRKHV